MAAAALLGLVATLAVALPLLYACAAAVVRGRFPALRNKRVCLLIAHPDDEAMFFAPTVLALTRPDTGNHVKMLCLSTGNARGLGETRRRELVKSGLRLGLRAADDVFVVDNPTDFPDSMAAAWDAAKISTLLGSAFAPQPVRPDAGIDVLITFDARGVSMHPNHVSLHAGARAFAASAPSVHLYTLTSVGLVRKYSSIVDVLATLAVWTLGLGRDHGRDHGRCPARLLFMNPLVGHGGLPTACSAMTDAHRSQMVWFRYLWISFSRYMLINDLRLDKVGTPPEARPGR